MALLRSRQDYFEFFFLNGTLNVSVSILVAYLFKSLQNTIIKYFFIRYFSSYKAWKFTAPPALALSKAYHVKIVRSDLHLVCVCVCVPVERSMDSSGRIKLSFIQVFKSNVQNVHHYSVNIIEVYFQNFLILISVSLELFLHKFSLVYSSYLIWWSVHSCKQYFSNNPRRKNLANLNLVILEATGLVLLNLSDNGLSAFWIMRRYCNFQVL